MTNINIYQENLFKQIAKKYGITIQQVHDIFNKVCEKTVLEIESFKQTDKGVRDIDSFKTIYIQNWGRFIPNKGQIKLVNKRLENNEAKLRTREDRKNNS